MLLSQSAPARHRRAVVLATDARGAHLAQFVAWRIARAEPVRDYDICVCTLGEPLPLAHPNLPEIRACAVDRAPFEDLRTTKRWPAETYLKYFLPVLFANDYDQIAYLDTDVLPLDTPLSQLFAAAEPGNAVSAVLAISGWSVRPNAGTIAYHRRLGLNGQPYCNAGVLVFDVAACIASNLWGRMLAENAMSVDTAKRFRFQDQSLLNCVQRGDWAPLSLRWNWQMYELPAKLVGRAKPHLLHFPGFTKPYLPNIPDFNRPYRRAYEDFFRDVLGQDMPEFTSGTRLPARTWPRKVTPRTVLRFVRAWFLHLTLLDHFGIAGAIPAWRLWQHVKQLEAGREATGRYPDRPY